jgi:hypothetical protein
MRAAVGRRTEFATTLSARSLSDRWLQAGFTSFAYRLAHLTLPRSLALLSISTLFYLA